MTILFFASQVSAVMGGQLASIPWLIEMPSFCRKDHSPIGSMFLELVSEERTFPRNTAPRNSAK